MIRSDEIDSGYKALSDALQGEWKFDDERYAGIRKKMELVMADLSSLFVDEMKDNLHDYLAGHVKDMAERAIEAVLLGNDKELQRWLNCDQGAYTGREHYATSWSGPIIHGKLFETGAVELRKRIVEAHPDLLKNERIKDLEAQLAAVILHSNKKDDEIERLRRERY